MERRGDMTNQEPTPLDEFLPLRPVEFHVLLSLAGGPRHGYGIMKEAAHRSGQEVIPDVGTLYRALRRMTEEQLIEPVDPPPGEGEDPRRKHYAITPFGRRIAAAEAQRLSTLVDAARAGGFLGRV
jgi:DNA-binding PadR family transcriptional regulator